MAVQLVLEPPHLDVRTTVSWPVVTLVKQIVYARKILFGPENTVAGQLVVLPVVIPVVYLHSGDYT